MIIKEDLGWYDRVRDINVDIKTDRQTKYDKHANKPTKSKYHYHKFHNLFDIEHKSRNLVKRIYVGLMS